MKSWTGEKGGALITAVLLGILISILSGVAMLFASTEVEATGRTVRETVARLLAESAIEQAAAWLNQAELPNQSAVIYPIFHGTEALPDLTYSDDRFLNDPVVGIFRTLGGLGRIREIRLYAPSRPDGLCTVQATAETTNGVRRAASLEFGATRLPPLRAALQAGIANIPDDSNVPRIWVHWGALRLAGNVRLGRTSDFPRKLAAADINGQSYGQAGTSLEDRWTEAWIGGAAIFDDPASPVPQNVHETQDPVPGISPDPWQYDRLKALAVKFGTYYVPDSNGRLYRNGVMDPLLGQTATEVFGDAGRPRGLVFIDTLDQRAPAVNNLTTLVLDSSAMAGLFYVNANVVLAPQGAGKAIQVLSPPADGSNNASTRVPTQLTDLSLQGVLHVAGRLSIEREVRVFGSVVAEQGFDGRGQLEVWYNYDLANGLFETFPVIFPLSGTWREWSAN
jgi:hypothetical protein